MTATEDQNSSHDAPNSDKAAEQSTVDPSITFDDDGESSFNVGALIIDAVAAAAAITFTALIVKDALPFLK